MKPHTYIHTWSAKSMHAKQSAGACVSASPNHRESPKVGNAIPWNWQMLAVIPLPSQSQIDASQVYICTTTRYFQTFHVIGGDPFAKTIPSAVSAGNFSYLQSSFSYRVSINSPQLRCNDLKIALTHLLHHKSWIRKLKKNAQETYNNINKLRKTYNNIDNIKKNNIGAHNQARITYIHS